jgi:hypothetical protein
MTALVGGEVQRTFSRHWRQLAGLSRQNTHEAGRQDFGDLVDSSSVLSLVVEVAHQQQLTQSFGKSRGLCAVSKQNEPGRTQTKLRADCALQNLPGKF